GTWILHTLRNVIGNDSLWFNILHGLTTDFRLSIVNSEMIVNYINKKTGADFHYFFNQYLKYPKPPRFVYQIKKKGRKTLLLYKWEAEVKDFRMPYMLLVNNSDLIKINPTTVFQTLTYHDKIKDLEFPEELFYVGILRK
ncbi:MAG TPA: hypothetical protein VNW99_04035, partial [Cytophagaceae bacterium]|nr:hypothetical protein [Cytophagaceae bacterium]